MLVLSRKINESLVISDNVVVRVLEVRGNNVRLGIDAPNDVLILRTELLSKKTAALPSVIHSGMVSHSATTAAIPQ